MSKSIQFDSKITEVGLDDLKLLVINGVAVRADDCIEVLRAFEDEMRDMAITDPRRFAGVLARCRNV